MKDILGTLQTFEYGFIIHDIIELILIILGMMMVMQFFRRMSLFLGDVYGSILGWIVWCLQTTWNTHGLGCCILNHYFPRLETFKYQQMPKIQPNICWKIEKKANGGLQVKHIQMFALFFHLSMCLNFFEIVGNKQVVSVQNWTLRKYILVRLSVLTTFSLGIIACDSV